MCGLKVTRDELRAYLIFCVSMGINHLPALDDYWSTDLDNPSSASECALIAQELIYG